MNWRTKLKQELDENPIKVIAVTGFAVTAAAKLIDALSAAQYRRAYAKEVNYKVRH